MVTVAFRVSLVACLALFAGALFTGSLTIERATAQRDSGPFVYYQITDLSEGSGHVGDPVLSADGTRAVFVDAPGTGEPETPNRVFVTSFAGGAITEVDAYESLCSCGSVVDISADGATVVSTDTVQVRIADAAGSRSLVTLASNEISGMKITGDAQTIVLVVRRDTTTADGTTALPRGIWTIESNGTGLRQLVDADDVAATLGIAIEQTGCCFHADGHPLDVSDDGGVLVFGAYGGDGEHLFAVNGDGSNLRVLRQGAGSVTRVAVSGDGATAAYEIIQAGSSENELGVVPVAGGANTLTEVALTHYSYYEPLQLSQDGSQLLVSPDGLLIDVASHERTLLAVAINDAGGAHEAVLTDGLARATMDAEARRFVYAMRTVRCADCTNLQEQVATMEIAPADLGEAPEIMQATIAPSTILVEGGSEATVEAQIGSSQTVIGVGFAALQNGTVDVNVGHLRNLLDDGASGDAAASDSIYTATGIIHSSMIFREDDTGPRTIRIAAETEDGSGLRHATALDIGTLNVEAAGSSEAGASSGAAGAARGVSADSP